MNFKRIILIGLWVIVVFAVVWLFVQLPEIKQNVQLNRNIGQHYEWYGFLNDHFWQDITLLIFSFGTSFLFWKRQTWGKQNKTRYLCLFTGIFSLISLLIILDAVRFHDKNVFLLGLFIFSLTSLLISTAFHNLTLQIKYLLLESVKIIFLGAMVFGINLFAGLLVIRPHHSGSYETGLFIMLFALVLGTIATIASLMINFSILIKHMHKEKEILNRKSVK